MSSYDRFICKNIFTSYVSLKHHMTLVSFCLLCNNLGNLWEFLGEWFTAPWQKIARTPKPKTTLWRLVWGYFIIFSGKITIIAVIDFLFFQFLQGRDLEVALHCQNVRSDFRYAYVSICFFSPFCLLSYCFTRKLIPGAPNDNFRKISVRKTIWDLEFSKFRACLHVLGFSNI